MNNDVALINYLDAIVDDILNDLLASGYDDVMLPETFYSMIVNNVIDYSKFEKNYINCQQYSGLDINQLIKKYMYAVYYSMNYKNDMEKVVENILCELLVTFDVNDPIVDECFEIEEVGVDVVDFFMNYKYFTNARKKRMFSFLKNDDNFSDALDCNDMLDILYSVNSNLEVTEEEYLIDDVLEIYDLLELKNIENNFNYSVDRLEELAPKVKNFLLLDNLVRNYGDNNNLSLKHEFSILLKNVYTEIYYSKINKLRKFNGIEKKYFNLITSNRLSFEEMFQKFICDEDFYKFLVKSFYLANVSSDSFELEERNSVLENSKMGEKIKKYKI